MGDCLVDPPDVDLGVVTVTIVDCSSAHRAEVFLLAPIAVNAAVSSVAERECNAGLAPYVSPADPGAARAYAVTHLIYSRQDRTSDNPLPSTVMCLLQSAEGGSLTGSAHRRP